MPTKIKSRRRRQIKLLEEREKKAIDIPLKGGRDSITV